LLIAVLALDGALDRRDGLALLATFVAWLVLVTLEARRQRSAAGEVLGEHRPVLAAALCLAGLTALVAAGHFVVTGAQGIAASFGMDVFVIGATIVAVGTSVPELATAIVSQLRRHSEVGLGTILGSNIFNGLFIIGVAATITPIRVAWESVSVALLFGIATIAITLPARSALIGRMRGLLLLALYVVYVGLIV
jgi:cation:H+ antiporter